MIWSFVLAAVGIAGIYLAGKKSKWGWGLGLGAQVLWLIFALVTAQYGFILTAVAYGAVYGKNLWQWHQEERPSTHLSAEKSTLESCFDNDGLTVLERREYADRYAAGPGRGLDDKGRETLRRIRERRNDQPKRDQPTRE